MNFLVPTDVGGEVGEVGEVGEGVRVGVSVTTHGVPTPDNSSMRFVCV